MQVSLHSHPPPVPAPASRALPSSLLPLPSRCFLLKEDALSSKRLFVRPLQCNSLLLAQLCCLAECSLFSLSLPLLLSLLRLCLQLVLETYNVPELSAGVNCTFEDLSEMDGLVVGSQIQCISPAAKEVPQIITENGEYPTAPPPVPLPPILTPHPASVLDALWRLS